MSRIALVRIFLSMLALVLCALAYMFISAFSPADRPSEHEISVDVQSIQPGQHRVVEWLQYRVIFIRTGDAVLRVYAIPTYWNNRENNLAWGLPEPTWARPIYPCYNLVVPVDSAGLIDAGGAIECKDPGMEPWWAAQLRWSIEGKNLGGYLPALESPKYVVKAGQVILGAVGR